MTSVYKNAPLVHTIFQARFPGETAVELARPKIQGAVRTELPKLYVPKVVIDMAPAMQPLVFRSEDGNEGFEIAINSFAYTTNQYGGYAEFKSRVLRFAQVFSEYVPEVQRLNRVGLRYINRLPMIRESRAAAIPLKDYLRVGLTLPPGVPEANLTELNSVFSVRLDGGELKVMLRNEAGDDPSGAEFIILDFDFVQTENLDIRRLDGYLDNAHQHTKQVFTDLLSERYFSFVKGDLE